MKNVSVVYICFINYFFRFFYKAFFPFQEFSHCSPFYDLPPLFGNPHHFFHAEITNLCKYIGSDEVCWSAPILDITFHKCILMISAEIVWKLEKNGEWKLWVLVLIQYTSIWISIWIEKGIVRALSLFRKVCWIWNLMKIYFNSFFIEIIFSCNFYWDQRKCPIKIFENHEN